MMTGRLEGPNMRLLFVMIAALTLPGCVARLAADVVTTPIRVAGKTVDVLTTSQDESDLKRGREARKAEERAEKERRKAAKAARNH
jgi:hypothetical protein